MSDEAVAGKPPRWLFDQYDLTERARWKATTEAITATELGTLRALDRAFNGAKHSVEALPTYDELMRRNREPEQTKPAWMREFERINADRMVGKKNETGD